MATTANGLVTAELSDAPNGPGGLLTLAQSVDARYGPTVADWTALLAVATPFTGMRVFVTSLGDFAFYNGTKWIAPEFNVRKLADEPVTSSAVLQNDDHLSYPIPGIGTYNVDVHLIGTSAANAAGDLNLAFTFPTGTFYLTAIGLDSSLAAGSSGTVQTIGGSITSGTAFASYGLSTSQTSIILNGTFVATATGTLQLQWAQAVSNANASTLKTGSSMKVKQVA